MNTFRSGSHPSAQLSAQTPTQPSTTTSSESAAADVEGLLPLYTPAQAAGLLAVRESWLRRRAGARTVACTFVGKHLRFSPADVAAVARAGARPLDPPRPLGRRSRRR